MTGSRDADLRAGVASCVFHAVLICLLISSSVYYRQHYLPLQRSSFAENPIELRVTTVPLPPPPIPAAAPTIPPVTTPAPAPPLQVPKAKPAPHKRLGAAAHRLHKLPPRASPAQPQPPIAPSVMPKVPPRALPLLPQVPVARAVIPQHPPRALPVGPIPMIAPAVLPRPSPQALAVKPQPAAIPILAPMPPPRALPVALPSPAIPTLAPVPPPRALPVALPPEAVPALASPVTAPTNAPPPTPVFSPIEGPDKTIFPHPPYPFSARDRGESGTVVMNVMFDARGGVTYVEVAQSSGVPVLDSATRSFIRTHWHLPAYAGQAVSVPVEYRLEKP